jgi:ribosomal protein S18 acetylase RimI-like enzyme
LLAAVAEEAVRRGARRLWLITRNDNLDALRFYQRRGMRLCAIHRDAIDQARLVKPSIPLVGNFGIAIRDELELDLRLNSRDPFGLRVLQSQCDACWALRFWRA